MAGRKPVRVKKARRDGTACPACTDLVRRGQMIATDRRQWMHAGCLIARQQAQAARAG